ncbi:MAG TPA: hypothetical protein VN920_15920, partial [Pyrinomonadaceae bacterium]|nr:hypothetical protein [Pyrinomonadaceae bacterium]
LAARAIDDFNQPFTGSGFLDHTVNGDTDHDYAPSSYSRSINHLRYAASAFTQTFARANLSIPSISSSRNRKSAAPIIPSTWPGFLPPTIAPVIASRARQ